MAVVIEKASVKSEQKIVGTAEFPVFDEKNPSIGLADIMSYDWKAQGYQSSEHAIVCLVNTQNMTNIKNEIRAKANPRLTQEKLNNLVTMEMAMLPVEVLQSMQNNPDAVLAKAEEIRTRIKKEYEEKAKSIAAADATEDAGD